MMDAYMREALTSQMNAVREVLKHNAAASPPKSPPPDAVDLVCVDGVWQVPKQSEWDRSDGMIELTYARR